MYALMNLSLILFLIGVLGFVLNRKNIILMLIFYWDNVTSNHFFNIGKFT